MSVEKLMSFRASLRTKHKAVVHFEKTPSAKERQLVLDLLGIDGMILGDGKVVDGMIVGFTDKTALDHFITDLNKDTDLKRIGAHAEMHR